MAIIPGGGAIDQVGVLLDLIKNPDQYQAALEEIKAAQTAAEEERAAAQLAVNDAQEQEAKARAAWKKADDARYYAEHTTQELHQARTDLQQQQADFDARTKATETRLAALQNDLAVQKASLADQQTNLLRQQAAFAQQVADWQAKVAVKEEELAQAKQLVDNQQKEIGAKLSNLRTLVNA